MNGLNFSELLKKSYTYELVFTKHAELRLNQRQIEKQIVIEHLRLPDSLKLVEKIAVIGNDEKYKLWFVPSKRTAYIYVVIINHLQKRIIVKTVVKQKLVWQKKVEKNAGQF